MCVFASVPPPLVGSSYAVQLLLESSFRAAFQVVHIHTPFASSVADMGRLSVSKIGRLFRYLLALMRESRRGLDVVVMVPAYARVPFVKDALGVLVARWITRTPVILWTHSNRLPDFFRESGFLMRALIRTVLQSAVRVVVLGDKFRAHLLPFVDADRIVVIPNGVPEPATRPRRTAALGEARILYLSNMLRAKGWPELLRAAELLIARHPHVRVDFFGSPGSDASSDELAATFAASLFPESIRWHGLALGPAKAEAFLAADIFCLPTAYPTEAQPIAILEAMSYGLPVVSCPAGGIDEIVEHEKTGLLVPMHDPDALAAALERLIGNPEERISLGEGGRKRFETSFSVERMAAQFTAMVHDVVRVA